MHKRNAGWHAILVAAISIAVLLTGCGRRNGVGEFEPGEKWLDDMRSGIKEHITDGATATKLLAEVDSLEEEVLAFDAARAVHYDRLKALDRSYSSNRRDFEKAIDDFNAIRIEHRNRIMDIRFRMCELTTPDDWKKLSDMDSGLLSQWQRDLEF